jgi:hypothetical protein
MLFEDQTKGQTTNQTQQTTNQEDWLAKIVETKGENFKDPQVLAKSKLEADNYIAELERQLKEMREDQTKESYAQKLLETLQNKGPNSVNGNPAQSQTPDGANTVNTKPEISEDVIKSLVEQTLTQREQQSTASQNTQLVQTTLQEKYGTEARGHVEKKAKELGLSMERLSALAAESPNAFFALIGEPRKEFTPIVNGSINTSAARLDVPSERNWQWYQNLRKQDKTKYYSPAIQQQMMQDKLRLGPRFGN